MDRMIANVNEIFVKMRHFMWTYFFTSIYYFLNTPVILYLKIFINKNFAVLPIKSFNVNFKYNLGLMQN